MPTGVYKRTKHWKWPEESKNKFKIYCKAINRKPPSRLGVKNTEEQKKKISNTKKRLGQKPKPMYGNDNPSKRPDVRKKISEKLKIVLKLRYKNKENHPRWLGGKSFEPYPIIFNNKLKKIIRKRDNNICQLCGLKKLNYKLSVHHIDYDKKNCLVDNLISLCRKCHSKVNADRIFWSTFFKNKINNKEKLYEKNRNTTDYERVE